jgi:hypothetical protein
MHRYLLMTLLAMLLSINAWSQTTEPGADPATGPAAEPTAEELAAEDEVKIDDADLDEESYADAEEKDFVPTEDIPTDQSIPFPTDI